MNHLFGCQILKFNFLIRALAKSGFASLRLQNRIKYLYLKACLTSIHVVFKDYPVLHTTLGVHLFHIVLLRLLCV